MQFSYSRVERYARCPFSYKLNYIDKVKMLDNYDADNPLFLGVGIHKGIETTLSEGIKEYYKNYAITTTNNVTETMKFEILIPKVKELLKGLKVQHEVKLSIDDVFIGYIDALIDRGDGVYDIIDFKYSNNKDSYLKSGQIHVYAFFYKLLHPEVKEIRVGYVFIPKYSKKKAKDANVIEYRKEMVKVLEQEKIEITYLPYDESKATSFLLACINISSKEKENVFPKKVTSLCYFCEYRDFCLYGENKMPLPVNKKRVVNKSDKMKIWIYGMPMCGKTYLANTFPAPLFLNTDGNLNSFDSPVVSIATSKNEISGRNIHGYEIFSNTVTDIVNASQNGTLEYKTIVIDLIDGVYNLARSYFCEKQKIEHESEQPLKSYDIIRTHFLNDISRLANLDINLVLISHEDKTRDICAKGGDKITSIQTTIPEKVALRLAGLMDLIVRLVKETEMGKPQRRLYLPANETEFGGSRLKTDKRFIDCTYDAILQLFKNDNLQQEVKQEVKQEKPKPQVTLKETEDHTGYDYAVESLDDPEEVELEPVGRKKKKTVTLEEVKKTPIEKPVEQEDDELPW